MDGGIFGLLGLIRDHRGAVEYDWRTRFGCGLSGVGHAMTITEAARLAATLERDPATQTFAAVADWKHPMDRATLILADQFDAFAKVKFKRPKPYPRPWDGGKRVQRHGNAAGRSRAEVIAILNAHGHNLPA